MAYRAGRAHRNRPGPDRHLPGAALAVADDQGVPLIVAFIVMRLQVRGDLGFQGGHEHPPRSLAGDLVEQGSPVHLALRRLVPDDLQHGCRLLPLARQGAAGAPDGVSDASTSAYVPFWQRQAEGHRGGAALSGPIQTVALNIFGQKEKEINAWYEEKHIPELLEYPGLQWARRHRRLAGGTRYLTLYHFASEEAVRGYMKSDIVRAAQADRQRYNPWMSILEHSAYAPILDFINSLG